MPVCVVVLANETTAQKLFENLVEATTPLNKCKLIRPSQQDGVEESTDLQEINPSKQLEVVEINAISLLNPKLSQKQRQKTMAVWLIPFGFLAGLIFSQMTGLKTFTNLGLPSWGESIFGSLLGMASGWLGSYAGAMSVNTANEDDLRSLRQRNERGEWLLFLETPVGVELPWRLVQEAEPLEVVGLSDT